MSFTMRPYQIEAIEAVEAAWAGGITRPACVLATGAGKTVIFSHIIKQHIDRLRAKNQRVLVLAHREKLLDQAEAKIKAEIPGVWTTVVKGARGQNEHQFADVVIASVQTMARPNRRAAIDRIGLVVVDECHNYAADSYMEVLRHYGCMDDSEDATPTVGFTATLTRMEGGLPAVWQSVAYVKKIHDLIKEGYLIAPKAHSVTVPGLNLATTRVTGGDLNTGDLAAALEDSKAFEVIAQNWLKLAQGRPTIAFMPNVATTHQLSAAFAAAGVAAESVTGSSGVRERRAAFERFDSGETTVLSSCMTLTEGFDAPQTSCVIIGRPTINPGLYIQMVGRGLRLHPGKDDCLVLDIAGASLKHSLAGVNDLESDCGAVCDCNCLSCGCGEQCKCGIQKCGCTCMDQHVQVRVCKCAGTDDCGCQCVGEGYEHLDTAPCFCKDMPECQCYAEGVEREQKEVGKDVLEVMTEVDILGAELKKSHYAWIKTPGGIDVLQIGADTAVFLFPAPDGGYFIGRVKGFREKAPVDRLDNGSMPADMARTWLEGLAAESDYTYNQKGASWKRKPASQAQKQLLTRMGVPYDDKTLKSGQASDMLTGARFGKSLDHRFSKYVQFAGRG